MTFKPMSGCQLESFEQLRYPVLMSPKLDGIRCLVRNGQAVSRTLKPIPNHHIRGLVSQLPHGLDGELITMNGLERSYEATSIVMTHEGEPEFRYEVFDYGYELPFQWRLRNASSLELPPFAVVVKHTLVESADEAQRIFDELVASGHEGAMTRSPSGFYKNGRSTPKEQTLVKWKVTEDEEATVIGVEPLESDENLKGFAFLPDLSRSGKFLLKAVGKLVCVYDDGAQTRVGTGFTDRQRVEIWERKDEVIAQRARITIKNYGRRKEGEAPRHPVFKGFRYD